MFVCTVAKGLSCHWMESQKRAFSSMDGPGEALSDATESSVSSTPVTSVTLSRDEVRQLRLARMARPVILLYNLRLSTPTFTTNFCSLAL